MAWDCCLFYCKVFQNLLPEIGYQHHAFFIFVRSEVRERQQNIVNGNLSGNSPDLTTEQIRIHTRTGRDYSLITAESAMCIYQYPNY